MIKLLAVDMDGTCLDGRSRMTDRTLWALRKAAEKGIIIVPATGRNLECIPHRLAAGTLRRTGTSDDHANKGLFRYVISSNGARVTDIRERKNIFRASVERADALTLLEKCRRKGMGIASHVRHRYLLQGRFLTTAGLLIYGKDAKGVYCVGIWKILSAEMTAKLKNSSFIFYFREQREGESHIEGLSFPVCGIYRDLCRGVFGARLKGKCAGRAGRTSRDRTGRDRVHR